jgi:ABC-type Mn2+/Zn2+ transport system permease subunit
MVFAFLIIPSVNALLFTKDRFKRLLLGWGFGFSGVAAGMEMSLRFDLAAAPSIVCAFAFILIFSFCCIKVRERFFT